MADGGGIVSTCESGRPDSNRRRPAWEAGILPTELRPRSLYRREPPVGIEPTTARLRIECSTTELLWHLRSMPWRGLEPRRLTAPPPQDGVSTNFTTRALQTARIARTSSISVRRSKPRAGLTGLEPATSGVTDRHSNQAELQPLLYSRRSSRPSATNHCRIAPRGIEPLSAP